jgi:lauroyl/myristoyl acyltransferase
MSSAISLVRQAYLKYCFYLARTIVFLFPVRYWYRVLYRICRLHGPLLRFLLAFPPLRNHPRRRIIVAWLMQSTLPHLVDTGRPFPIPICDSGVEAILEAQKNPHGVVLCSVHLPFIRMVLRRLVELGIPPTAVIAGASAQASGRLAVWGMAESLPALVPDKDVLFKVRSILRHGGVVGTLIDVDLSAPMNANVFRLIRSIGARLVFFTTELQPDGEIMVDFFAPPDPFCLSDKSVLSNLSALRSRAARILQLPSEQPAIAMRPLKREVPPIHVADLDVDSSS